MDIHIQNYIKFKTGREFSKEDIQKILDYINDNSKKFNSTRAIQIENYSEHFKYIVDNNLSIKYDDSDEHYKLKCIDNNYGIFIVDNFLSNTQCLKLINLIENSDYKHFGFTSSLVDKSKGKNLEELFTGKKSIDMDLADFNLNVQGLSDDKINKHNEEKKIFTSFNNFIIKRLNNIGRNFRQFYLWPGSNEDYNSSDITLRKYYKESGGYDYHNDYIFGDKNARVMTFIIYLGNVYQGGETKFLHQNKKVKSLSGRLLMFPPTHNYLHIGLPPISNDKYIITSFLIANQNNK